jgi:predicted Rossmann fold flavoprotein
MMTPFDVIIVGGGAAGFFTAINIAEKNPNLKIAILERGTTVLGKVKVSGGGRCNVTHACFTPNELVQFYPRGEKELRGPFHQFGTKETLAWFENHGVNLKTEPDGRMFPVSNSSQTIIDCFTTTAQKLKISVIRSQSVQHVCKVENHWEIKSQSQNYSCEKLVFATGSNPKIWELLATLHHKIIPPVPSLFTFNVGDERIQNLMGVATTVTATVKESKLKTSGPLLITHWGFSGPAILKLSAWGARILFDKNYQFILQINWLNDVSFEETEKMLLQTKQSNPKKTIIKQPLFELPTRLWESLVQASGIANVTTWADVSKKQLTQVAEQLTKSTFTVNGKSTFKEEFVTAGGIDLKEIHFKTMESKIHKNLYFAGEIMNIDAITGGFNFQNAWTSGFLVAEAVAG